eukprot:COSAG01_NODE_28206_length_666_cov_3.275132_1_plen_91_part_00
MGKGLPGGRRQAGNIDYRIEPRRSVAPPDRPRRSAPSAQRSFHSHGGGAFKRQAGWFSGPSRRGWVWGEDPASWAGSQEPAVQAGSAGEN